MMRNEDFSDPEQYIYRTKKGLDEQVIRDISAQKNEPEWMLAYRLRAFEYFICQPMPTWGPDISALDMSDIYYYIKPLEYQARSWDDVPKNIKATFDRLGVPESEKKYLAGLGAQYESEVVYHNLKEEWEALGVIFLDADSGLKRYPDIFQRYFGSVVSFDDNKFAALNTAVWSGGSFIYIPQGVEVTVPLQTYFRINAKSMGQFERTLIIVETGASVHYIEGCTAPTYERHSLHSAVVEIIANEGAKVRYSTIQNWSKSVFNLVTKRAFVYKNAFVEWIDGNIGSGITMKYPAVILKEPGARAEVLSIAMASSAGQVQDSGAKAIHCASHTTSRIISKSISKNGGRSSYRGIVKVLKGAKKCKSFVSCDALLLDGDSVADAYPYLESNESIVDIGHEARVSKIGEAQLFYLISRGISVTEAHTMIVNWFIAPFVKELPMEYALEMNRLIELEMEGSI